MEISEVFDDVKDIIGKDNIKWLVIGLVGVFLIILSQQNKKEETAVVTVSTGVASYPDSVTNADTIIASLQNSIDYAVGEMQDYTDSKFKANQDYIEQGLAKATDMYEKNYDEIQSSIEKMQNTIKDNTNTVTGGSIPVIPTLGKGEFERTYGNRTYDEIGGGVYVKSEFY